MERFDTTRICPTRIFATWGLYALAVTVVCQLIAARGFPPPVGWAVALGMGVLVLVWTGEI